MIWPLWLICLSIDLMLAVSFLPSQAASSKVFFVESAKGWFCGHLAKSMKTPLNYWVQVFPLKGTVIFWACKDILDSCVIPALWQQFGKGHFCFQHGCAQSHPIGLIWCGGSQVACTEPWPQPHWTLLGWIVSQVFSRNISSRPLKGLKFPQTCFEILWKAFTEE